MDILYQRRRASAAEVQHGLPDPPSYSAVRAMLRMLEEKGHIRHEEQAGRYIFLPTVSREKAKFSALQHLVETFFDGSARKVSRDELNRLSRLIENAKKQGV